MSCRAAELGAAGPLICHWSSILRCVGADDAELSKGGVSRRHHIKLGSCLSDFKADHESCYGEEEFHPNI